MKHIRYQMQEAFRAERLYLCDSYITRIEVQGDTTIFAFSDGLMTNIHTSDQSFERTGEAVCSIEHESLDDIICFVRKELCLFGQLIHFGKQVTLRQLMDEVNKGKIRLEIIQEYYYDGRLYWICSKRKKWNGRADEVTIRMDSMTQFELTMQVSDT